MENDLRTIEEVIRLLYASVSFDANNPPTWDRLRRLFHPRGQLFRNLRETQEVYSVETFIQWVNKARQQGLVSFFEEETDASTHLMGGLAHRTSHYKASTGGPSGAIQVGINSIQMMKCDGEWKVLSLAWEVPGCKS